MKDLKNLVLVAAMMSTGAAFAACPCPCPAQVENYAHPTFFGSSAQKTIEAQAKQMYVVGQKTKPCKKAKKIEGKENVLLDGWSAGVLDLIKQNSKGLFNPKMPILRSEMAVVLAEGLSIKKIKVKHQYIDISENYWAKSWIDKALSEGVMIGYPDRYFRPDQPITKAEVFATLAQLINVPYDKNGSIDTVKGYKMEQIPNWAIAPTKEVMAAGLLENVPDPEKVAKCKYLSKEQVATLVYALRQKYLFNSKFSNSAYAATYVTVKMTERIDAKHSNIGDSIWAKTTETVTVNGKTFEAGSQVKGEVVGISRPGIKNPGYVKVKFTEITNGNTCEKLGRTITEACAKKTKNTNVVARVLASPFSATGRVAGVTGRTGAAVANVASNGTERYGDNWSNAFANVSSLQPKSALKNLGQSFVTVGYGVYDITKLAVSGTFGVLYEFCDELVYIVLPSKSNDSSLNVGEELVIGF